VRDGVGNDLEYGMGARVLVAVDVRFHPGALYSPDVFRVLLVKGELDVCLAELNLFETARSIWDGTTRDSARERTRAPSRHFAPGRLKTCPRNQKIGLAP
jgi:hypothetical protein